MGKKKYNPKALKTMAEIALGHRENASRGDMKSGWLWMDFIDKMQRRTMLPERMIIVKLQQYAVMEV